MQGASGMAEIGLVEYFAMGEAIGILATLFVGFYYSRKQMQDCRVNVKGSGEF